METKAGGRSWNLLRADGGCADAVPRALSYSRDVRYAPTDGGATDSGARHGPGLTKTEGPKPECVLALIAATFNSRAKKNVGRHQPPEEGRLDTVSQGAYRAL